MKVFICVLTLTMTCTQIDVQQAQQVDPSVIAQQAQPVELIILEDNTSLLCLEGGC